METRAKENKEFVNFLFDQLFKHTDTDMIDLHGDDTCCDHLEFEQLVLFSWTTLNGEHTAKDYYLM